LPRRSAGVGFLILGVVLLLLFQELFHPPENTLLWYSALDAGHVLLFGTISLIALGLAHLLSARRGVAAYFPAFGATFVLAVVTEGLQYFGPRDADLVDLARSLAGAAGFLLVAMALDRRLVVSRGRRAALVVGSLVVVAAGLVTFAWVVRAYEERGKAFPSICSFDASWETVFYGALRAELEVTELPEPWVSWGGAENRAGKLTFLTARYSGFHVSEVEPDWRGHRWFCFEVYSGLSGAVELVLRIDDVHHDGRVDDRFNRGVVIGPGRNAVRIGVEEIREGPRGRELDLSRVRGVGVFAVEVDSVFSVYLDGFRLEE
jgi:hypothetical protein